MVGTTIAATQEIESDSRRWNLILTDQWGNKLESANGDIISMSHTIETTNSILTIGDVFTQNINIELRRGIDKDGTQFDYDENATVSITYGLRDAPGLIHMGEFRVNKITKVMDRIRLQLKDTIETFMNDKYAPSSSLTYPVGILTVMEDICSPINITAYEPLCLISGGSAGSYTYSKTYDKAGSVLYVKSSAPADAQGYPIELTQAEVQVLSGKKVSEALSICAGLIGCMVAPGRDGTLVCVKPSRVPYTIGLDRAKEPQFSGETVTIGFAKCKVSDNLTLSYPNSIPQGAKGITFENPLMTQSRLNAAAEGFVGLTFRAGLIDHRLGDPRLDPMDIIGYQSNYERDTNDDPITFLMPLMSFDYRFDGGLSCNLRSEIKEDTNG